MTKCKPDVKDFAPPSDALCELLTFKQQVGPYNFAYEPQSSVGKEATKMKLTKEERLPLAKMLHEGNGAA